MNLRKTILTSNILRLLFRDGSLMDNYTSEPGNFISYFEYSNLEENYNHPFILYFNKQPNAPSYKNEIFNKMNAYEGDDVSKYLSYHFDKYLLKEKFISFLLNEATSRLDSLKIYPLFLKKSTRRREKTLNSCLRWVNQERKVLESKMASIVSTTNTANKISVIIQQNLSETTINNILQNDLSENIFKDLEDVILNIEKKHSQILRIKVEEYRCNVDNIYNSFESFKNHTTLGLHTISENITNNSKHIEQANINFSINNKENIDNQNNILKQMDDFGNANIESEGKEKLKIFILVMILLKDLNASNGEPYFGKFTNTDIAKILRLNFQFFKSDDKKIDTIIKNYINKINKDYSVSKKKNEADESFKKMFEFANSLTYGS